MRPILSHSSLTCLQHIHRYISCNKTAPSTHDDGGGRMTCGDADDASSINSCPKTSHNNLCLCNVCVPSGFMCDKHHYVTYMRFVRRICVYDCGWSAWGSRTEGDAAPARFIVSAWCLPRAQTTCHPQRLMECESV